MRERLDNLTKLVNCKFIPPSDSKRRFPGGSKSDMDSIKARWQAINQPEIQAQLQTDDATLKAFSRNIENCIGRITMPLGIAGPLRINGAYAQGDFLLPLATTEATLVASFHRGARIITSAGGCNTAVIHEGMSRTPCFIFDGMSEALSFVQWVKQHQLSIKQKAEATTKYGKLLDISAALEGNYAYLVLDYDTGDAAGQNMVTIATQAACLYILENYPKTPRMSLVESNLSGDKKATSCCFTNVRGKKAVAEVVIPNATLERMLRTNAVIMTEANRVATSGAMISGSIGVNGHYANGLTALFIACGQDAACVAEASIGITRMDVTASGDLRMSVSLPNLPVGTVGGGTSLPTQKACLDILN